MLTGKKLPLKSVITFFEVDEVNVHVVLDCMPTIDVECCLA